MYINTMATYRKNALRVLLEMVVGVSANSSKKIQMALSKVQFKVWWLCPYKRWKYASNKMGLRPWQKCIPYKNCNHKLQSWWFFSTFSPVIAHFNHELSEIYHYNELLTNCEHLSHRKKRGFFNRVGSVANGLFGLLDDFFAQKYWNSTSERRSFADSIQKSNFISRSLKQHTYSDGKNN